MMENFSDPVIKKDELLINEEEYRSICKFNGNQTSNYNGGNVVVNWSWYMDILDKIESLGYDTGICGISIDGDKLTEVIISPITKIGGSVEFHYKQKESKLKLTHQMIMDFVRWYEISQV